MSHMEQANKHRTHMELLGRSLGPKAETLGKWLPAIEEKCQELGENFKVWMLYLRAEDPVPLPAPKTEHCSYPKELLLSLGLGMMNYS